jgi:ribokinase
MTDRVLIAGSINRDIVVTAARHPRLGETLAGEALHILPGGKGANQAVAAARSGASTALICVVGDDDAGAWLKRFLSESDVSLDYVRTAVGIASGAAVVVVGGGENSIIVVAGANAELGLADVEDVEVSSRDVLVSQFEIADDTIVAFFEKGRAANARTILNPSPSRDCPPKLWGLSDIVVVNEIELDFLAGRDRKAARTGDKLSVARSLLTRDDQVIVVTLGARGAVVVSREVTESFAGRPVLPIDTTGAGDCFLGVLAGRLVAGTGLSAALRCANVAASLCVQRVGAGPAMPTTEEILAAQAGWAHSRRDM